MEGPDEAWSFPEAPARAELDWRSLYEQERARAEAAETRLDAARRGELEARCSAGSWKSQFEKCRIKLTAAVEETKASKCSTTKLLPRDVRRLHKALEESRNRKDTISVLSREVRGLRKTAEAAEKHKDTIRMLSSENLQLHAKLRRLRDQQDVIRYQSSETYRLGIALGASEARKGVLKAKLAKLIAARTTLSKPIAGTQLRAALRRSRHQKKTIKSQSKEIRRLRRILRSSEARNEALEAKLVRLRATGAVLSRALYGRKSEQQEKTPSERRRGHQPGAPGNGRTVRPALEEKTEQHDPSADECVCRRCGEPYARNGDRVSEIIEIDIKAHKRVINRSRWRRACTCESSPWEVSAAPVPRLFPNTAYGTSVWSRLLFEHYACMRPLNRISAWMSDQGLPIAAGTLANSVPRFLPIFEPLHDAILAHQNHETVRHGDETTWRVQALREKGRSSRAWLWTSVSADAVYFHIDPRRNAEAAEKLFAAAAVHTVLVCDRYSAYKKLARLLGGLVTLAWCWSHQRRDFIDGAAGQVQMTAWCQEWIERIAAIYRLNRARLVHYDPGRKRQTKAFTAAQVALKEALDGLFARAERELADLPEGAREGKPLRSLVNHREGLCVFLDKPQVPMDNNLAERALRGPAIGRRLSFGSDSEEGALLTARMYSVIGTLKMNGIDVLRWLSEWLEACAANGGRPPDDLSPWLPWSMSGERRRVLSMTPG